MRACVASEENKDLLKENSEVERSTHAKWFWTVLSKYVRKKNILNHLNEITVLHEWLNVKSRASQLVSGKTERSVLIRNCDGLFFYFLISYKSWADYKFQVIPRFENVSFKTTNIFHYTAVCTLPPRKYRNPSGRLPHKITLLPILLFYLNIKVDLMFLVLCYLQIKLTVFNYKSCFFPHRQFNITHSSGVIVNSKTEIFFASVYHTIRISYQLLPIFYLSSVCITNQGVFRPWSMCCVWWISCAEQVEIGYHPSKKLIVSVEWWSLESRKIKNKTQNCPKY